VRVARLVLAHPVVGLGVALLLRSGLGAAPWDVFHGGLAGTVGLDIGVATTLTSLAAVALAYRLGTKPGIATAINALALGPCIDAALAILPAAPGPWIGLAYLAAGIALLGAGTGLFLAARLGAAPRDSVVLALTRRYAWTTRRARTIVELVALALGIALGGNLGWGTWIYALAIGPAVHAGISYFEEDRDD
jgi:uncharacterized membrane protein YczE